MYGGVGVFLFATVETIQRHVAAHGNAPCALNSQLLDETRNEGDEEGAAARIGPATSFSASAKSRAQGHTQVISFRAAIGPQLCPRTNAGP